MRLAVPLTLLAITLTACGDEFYMPPPRANTDAVWLWTGAQADAPACPVESLVLWEGWADEAASQECGSCECGPAACALPSKITTHAPTCAGGEKAPVIFETGEDWNGACSAPAPAIPPNAFASVTYEPPAVAPCVPSPTPDLPPITATFARACVAKRELVKPVNTAFCITPEEDGTCRETFPVRRTFTTQLVDHRACSPCECDAPIGGKCTAHITLYEDTDCSTELYSSTLSDTDAPLCQDVLLRAPLAAMRANLTQLEPGVCAAKRSRSVVFGTVERGAVQVACCEK